jgi:2-C-methyl-D-erythritol 4-phosphate cytidylyltransferase/2-C-methyl-D-erythritol 2,4-cyclodiphosphate synthase
VTDTVGAVDGAGTIEATRAIPFVWYRRCKHLLFPALLEAHRRAAQGRDDFTDDAALAEWAG